MNEHVQHTEGPWHLKDDYEDKGDGIVTGVWTEDECIVAEICGGGSQLGFDGDMANAHLIAAAPDLLEVCELAIKLSKPLPSTATSKEWAEHEQRAAKFATLLLAAVAKARGESK